MAAWGGDGNWLQQLVQRFMQGRNIVNQDIINTGIPSRLGHGIGNLLRGDFSNSPIGKGIQSLQGAAQYDPVAEKKRQETLLNAGINAGNAVGNALGGWPYNQPTPTPTPGRAPGPQKPVAPAIAKKASATARVASRVVSPPKSAPVVKPRKNRGY